MELAEDVKSIWTGRITKRYKTTTLLHGAEKSIVSQRRMPLDDDFADNKLVGVSTFRNYWARRGSSFIPGAPVHGPGNELDQTSQVPGPRDQSAGLDRQTA